MPAALCFEHFAQSGAAGAGIVSHNGAKKDCFTRRHEDTKARRSCASSQRSPHTPYFVIPAKAGTYLVMQRHRSTLTPRALSGSEMGSRLRGNDEGMVEYQCHE